MKNKYLLIALFMTAISMAPASYAEGLSIKSGDTLLKLISAHKGKKITVRLASGEELTGVVKETTPELVQLKELSGKEYFDAVIDANKISAVIIRTK